MPPAHDDQHDPQVPGLARERTQLAWTRTAIAFAAIGAATLKTSVAAGLTVIALSTPAWLLPRLFSVTPAAEARPGRFRLITAAVTAVAVVALVVALL